MATYEEKQQNPVGSALGDAGVAIVGGLDTAKKKLKKAAGSMASVDAARKKVKSQPATDYTQQGVNKTVPAVIAAQQDAGFANTPGPDSPAVTDTTAAAPVDPSVFSAEQYNEGGLSPEQQAVRAQNYQMRLDDKNASLAEADSFRSGRMDQGLATAQNQAPVDVIRGTGREMLGDGGDGSDYQVYSGDVNNAANRAASKADEIRRNVFHRPGDSDALMAARIGVASRAADNYLNTNVRADTDQARIASNERTGMANVGARYAGLDSAERVASGANRSREEVAALGLDAAPDYSDMLEQGNALYTMQAQQQQMADIDARTDIGDAEKQKLRDQVMMMSQSSSYGAF